MHKTKPRLLRKSLITLLAGMMIIVLVPYLRTVIYLSPESKVFTGTEWYVPYTDVTDSLLRANFHAHSRSWAGLTWGENTASEVIAAYAEKGYQIPALSNYHKIADSSLYAPPLIYLPVYEHGFNVKKVHCLCIGAHEVSFWEYPWHLTLHHTRHIIADLRKHCDLVALAHPGARQAHGPEELQALTGLQLMEVANTQGARTGFWDSMLSNGQVVWFLANDDTHALHDGEAFMRWNMIYVDTPSAETAIASLRRGNHYGILSYDGACEDNRLTAFKIQADTLHISTRDTFNRIDFIGQDGVHLRSSSRDTNSYYVLRKTDTYVRAEVHQDHCVLYLNPVVRYDGSHLPYDTALTPMRDEFRTWLWRCVFLLILVSVIYTWLRLIRRR